jgi:hypothetical protein
VTWQKMRMEPDVGGNRFGYAKNTRRGDSVTPLLNLRRPADRLHMPNRTAVFQRSLRARTADLIVGSGLL